MKTKSKKSFQKIDDSSSIRETQKNNRNYVLSHIQLKNQKNNSKNMIRERKTKNVKFSKSNDKKRDFEKTRKNFSSKSLIDEKPFIKVSK